MLCLGISTLYVVTHPQTLPQAGPSLNVPFYIGVTTTTPSSAHAAKREMTGAQTARARRLWTQRWGKGGIARGRGVGFDMSCFECPFRGRYG